MAVTWNPKTNSLEYTPDAAPVAAPKPVAKQTPAQAKATAIMDQDQARTDAYQAALTAPAKTAAEINAINTGVQAATIASGNVYDPTRALTVSTQASLNPQVQTTLNFAGNNTTPKDTNPPASGLTSEQLDAFALLKSVFTSYGLAEMVPSITKLMQANVGPNQAALMLKTDPNYNGPYLKRFAGNQARVAAGKNALDEATYLSLENRFREQLSAYGQDKYATQDEFANLIGNDIAPTELGSRLDLAVNQVQNADPNILNTLKQFYPTISQSDLVGYFLKPDQALVDLTQKVTASEIGAAALQQNLTPLTTDRMLELQKLGVTQDAARTGFQNVATVLPEAKKLSSIYGEADIKYTQQTGEEEFLQGTASAARKRRQLAQLEKASFSGDSGVDTARGSSLARNMQGSF
jgi:hypothetical protein